MESAVTKEETWFDSQLSDLIETAYQRVQSHWLNYGMKPEDFQLFGVECPRHMQRIEEIEDMISSPMPENEVADLLQKWERNYEYVFKRRNLHRNSGGQG